MKRVKLCCILDENQYFNPWLDCWAAMRGRKIIRRLCEKDTKIHFCEAAVLPGQVVPASSACTDCKK